MNKFLERLAEAICDAHTVPGVYHATTQKAREHWWPIALAAFETARLSKCDASVGALAALLPFRDTALAKKMLEIAEEAASEAAPPKWKEKTTVLKSAAWEGQGMLRLSDGDDVDAGDLAEAGFLPEHSTGREGTWTITLRFEETGGV